MKVEEDLWVCSAWDHRGKCMKEASRWFHNPTPEPPFQSIHSSCNGCALSVEKYYGDKWMEVSRNEMEVLRVMTS